MAALCNRAGHIYFHPVVSSSSLWSPYVIGQTIIFLPCYFYLLSSFFLKKLLSSNISSTCPHNMVNFGPLATEIVSLVWGNPGNFNRFRVLAALLHGTLVVGVSHLPMWSSV